MTTRTLGLSLLTLVLAAVPFRLSAGEDEAHVQLTRKGPLTGGERSTERFEVLSPMKQLRVRLWLELADGSVSWQLLDPDGEVRWRGTAASGSGTVDEQQELPAVAGEWTLKLTPVAADGRYRLRWRGDS